MKFILEKISIFIFILAAIALTLILVIFYFNTQKVKSTSDLVEHTQEVLRISDDVLLDILSIESGSRGYILTGDELFLKPFDDAIITIKSNMEELIRQTKNVPNQQSRIYSLKNATEERVVFIKKTIESMKLYGLEETEKIVENGKGQILTNKIRNLFADINSEEFRLLKQRKQAVENNAQNLTLVFMVLSVIIVVVLITVFISINANLNERKKADRDIRKLNEELEQKVIERTEQLESVNNELEAFSYSVSHDLRAPLRAVNGYAKILQEDYTTMLDDYGVSSLTAILNNSKKMGKLIDDLLAFSRLGRKALSTSEINMTVLVKSIRQEEINGNSGEIEFTVPELLPAKGQQGLIKQVWVNLISNAIKFSKHELKTNIVIGSYYKDNLVVYYVKDNGAGFDMQYYDKLFGVFQRLHSQDEFEGTGIGLAIVQKIVNRHNGTVWAESKLNEGSCFYFSLPNINS